MPLVPSLQSSSYVRVQILCCLQYVCIERVTQPASIITSMWMLATEYITEPDVSGSEAAADGPMWLVRVIELE